MCSCRISLADFRELSNNETRAPGVRSVKTEISAPNWSTGVGIPKVRVRVPAASPSSTLPFMNGNARPASKNYLALNLNEFERDIHVVTNRNAGRHFNLDCGNGGLPRCLGASQHFRRYI